jgi:hypothetical protein
VEEQRRLPVKEAAQLLGTTEHALRQRLYRGTLQYEKDDRGRVYVLLTPGDTEPHGEVHGENLGDARRDARGDTQREANLVSGELVEELRDRVQSLENQLVHEREANRENRRLLAAALERVPAIEAPPDTPAHNASSEPRESPVTPSETGGSNTTGPTDAEAAEKPSWWRRFFGFE